MSFEDFINQPGFGTRLLLPHALSMRFRALGNLNRTIKIRCPCAVGAEYIQVLKALCFNHLHVQQNRECSSVWCKEQYFLCLRLLPYLILPWDGHAARVELCVKVFIVYIKVDSLHCGELVDIHNVLTVYGSWLRKQKWVITTFTRDGILIIV